MVTVALEPTEFSLVNFDPAAIVSTVESLCDQLGIGADETVKITVDEASPLTRARLDSIDPISIQCEGGALEDTKRPRELSEARIVDTVGRLLLRASDRRSEAFADAPPEVDLDLALQAAWDVYCIGRLVRLGHRGQRKRRLYQFRNRHGFTDAADAAFERLWTADGLSWAEISTISTDARSVLA